MAQSAGVCEAQTAREREKKTSPTPALSAKAKAINQTLEKRIPIRFGEGISLEDALAYIVRSTRGSNTPGTPIYVEPKGLSEAEVSMASTVRLNIEGKALRATLKLMLDQLKLAYYVKDDILFISSNRGIERERKDSRTIAADDTAETKATIAALEKPMSVPCADETPFERLLEHIQKSGPKDEDGVSIQFAPDTKEMAKARKSMSSFVRNLGFDDVSAKTILRLAVNQLDLAYDVKDGIVIISSPEAIKTQLQAGEKTSGDRSR
jgi:hypothetical protein